MAPAISRNPFESSFCSRRRRGQSHLPSEDWITSCVRGRRSLGASSGHCCGCWHFGLQGAVGARGFTRILASSHAAPAVPPEQVAAVERARSGLGEEAESGSFPRSRQPPCGSAVLGPREEMGEWLAKSGCPGGSLTRPPTRGERSLHPALISAGLIGQYSQLLSAKHPWMLSGHPLRVCWDSEQDALGISPELRAEKWALS